MLLILVKWNNHSQFSVVEWRENKAQSDISIFRIVSLCARIPERKTCHFNFVLYSIFRIVSLCVRIPERKTCHFKWDVYCWDLNQDLQSSNNMIKDSCKYNAKSSSPKSRLLIIFFPPSHSRCSHSWVTWDFRKKSC